MTGSPRLSPLTLLPSHLPSHATFTTLSFARLHLLMISIRWNQFALMDDLLFSLSLSHNDAAL